MQSSFRQEPSSRLNQGAALNQEYGDRPAPTDSTIPTLGLSFTYMVQTTKYQFEKFVDNRALANRTLAHLILIILAVLAIGISHLKLAWNSIRAIQPLQQPII